MTGLAMSTLVLHTSAGAFPVEVFEAEMPKAAGLLRAMVNGTLPVSGRISANRGQRRLFSGLDLYRVSAGFIAHSTNPALDALGHELPRSAVEFSGRAFDQSYLVGMTSSFQLIITTQPTPWMNGHHLVVGTVAGAAGRGIIDQIGPTKNANTVALHDMIFE